MNSVKLRMASMSISTPSGIIQDRFYQYNHSV
jgi:hypothetical protein